MHLYSFLFSIVSKVPFYNWCHYNINEKWFICNEILYYIINIIIFVSSKKSGKKSKKGPIWSETQRRYFQNLWKRKFGLLTDPLHDSYLMKFFLAKSNNIYTLCGVINHPTNICFFSYSSHLHYCSLSLSLYSLRHIL